jgi:hypothetical protein
MISILSRAGGLSVSGRLTAPHDTNAPARMRYVNLTW